MRNTITRPNGYNGDTYEAFIPPIREESGGWVTLEVVDRPGYVCFLPTDVYEEKVRKANEEKP